MKNLIRIIFTTILCIPAFLFANDIQFTSDPVLKTVNTTAETADIEFSLSWENSWRNNIAGAGYETPYNYDAAWVFIKYSGADGIWKHATLRAAGHSTPAEATFSIPSDRKGAFIYRAENGSGTNIWDNIVLRWDYGFDGFVDFENIQIKLFAIEMVYIPQGSFFVGDNGATARVWRQFHKVLADATDDTPFEITSEDAITLGGTTEGNLGNHNNFSANPFETYVDDFDNATTQTLPAAFPKGYNAFYIMKHEITQKQYVDFLNTLTRAQQNTRTYTDVSGTAITNVYVMTNTATVFGTYRNGVRVQTPVDNTTDPLTFFCDLNGNGVPNEIDDGMHVACNYLGANASNRYSDVQAYLFWAALRPMTELEFEKACSGSNAAPWSQTAGLDLAPNGQYYTSLIRAAGLVDDQQNPGTESELIINPANANAAHRAPAEAPGPYRTGVFAKAATNRASSGASYYGVMELGGNLTEPVVSVSNALNMNSRAFNGMHGSGTLNALGDPQNTFFWPIAIGYKGGSFNLGNLTLRVTERNRTTAIINFRTDNWQSGGRGVRTAE
jgi:formylglycine-generating enzyme required for sulfatase activity